jgi:uncharacterized protein DUF1592/uncharacterized protein DUF1588/uncharacterized protein DUF1595/uncharacterized protein DUF1585/uncharacterized protein DUF1587
MGTKTSRWLKRIGLTQADAAPQIHRTIPSRARPTPGLGAALLSLTVAAATISACSGGGETNPFPTSTSGGPSTSGVGGSGGSSSTTTSSSGSSGTGGAPVVPIKPAPAGARRLIGRQYLGSIRTLLGDNAAVAATAPGDPQLNGFETIGATDLATPASSVETYETSALAVASAVVSDPAVVTTILPCVPNGATDYACLRSFVTTFGRLAWRRALTDAEITRVTAAGVAAAKAYNSFDAGLGTTISCLLQSPYFLYIIEIGAPDKDDPKVQRLTPLELATRMSFFLLNSTPDAKLLDDAEKGALDDEDGIRAAATAMLQRPEARTTLKAFYAEIYHLNELTSASKDPVLFPQFTPALKASMQEETLRLIDDVVWTRDADAREILSADYTFVDADLASLYGASVPQGGGFTKVTLPAVQKRAGILGQASFLTRGAHDKETSPTRRGNFVREAILCDPIPPPPPTVNPVLPDDGTPKTVKQKLEQHMQDASCSGCHSMMDPIGFALENFDPIGQYRTTDQGFPIDTTAQTDDLGAFASAPELAVLLTKDPRSSYCMVEKLYRQSMGHLETAGEQPAVEDLRKAFAGKGHSVRSLLVELSASRAFRLVGAPK